MIDFTQGAEVAGMPSQWIHGQPRGSVESDLAIQVHQVDEHTVILRQSKSLTYEAPFLYLLFGKDRALLLDTGAIEDAERMPVRDTVDQLMAAWLAEHQPQTPRAYELIVAHTHGHGDHIAGDAQFAQRPDTTVVAPDVSSVRAFFGFEQWPGEVVNFDLGGRMLRITGCPGHHEASIAVYDRWTRTLFTGDSVYPGRLYVRDADAFADSLDRLVAIAESEPVAWVLGCHIEMTEEPRIDYPIGTRFQPNEPPLQMTVDQLRQVRDAAHATRHDAGVHVFDDFLIFNGRCIGGVIKQLWRARRARL